MHARQKPCTTSRSTVRRAATHRFYYHICCRVPSALNNMLHQPQVHLLGCHCSLIRTTFHRTLRPSPIAFAGLRD